MSFNCNICNKDYASYKSLWKHNKTFHKPDVVKSITTVVVEEQHNGNNACKYCDKKLSDRTSRWRHEQKCKEKEEKDKLEKLEEKIKQLENLIDKHGKTKNSNKGTINKGNINTNTYVNGDNINNINIKIELGAENIKLLSEEQKLKVLKSINYGELPIVKLIDELYKNKENRNVKISNLQNNTALVYDGDNETFKAVSKKNVINDIISTRNIDVKTFFNEYNNTNKLTEKTKTAVNKYIEKLNTINENDKDLKKFVNEHKEQIIYLIYNLTMMVENDDTD